MAAERARPLHRAREWIVAVVIVAVVVILGAVAVVAPGVFPHDAGGRRHRSVVVAADGCPSKRCPEGRATTHVLKYPAGAHTPWQYQRVIPGRKPFRSNK